MKKIILLSIIFIVSSIVYASETQKELNQECSNNKLQIIKLLNKISKPESGFYEIQISQFYEATFFENLVKFCNNIDDKINNTYREDTLLNFIYGEFDSTLFWYISNRRDLIIERLKQYINILMEYGANPHANKGTHSAYQLAKNRVHHKVHLQEARYFKRLFFRKFGLRKKIIKESLDRSLIPDLSNIVWEYLYSKN